MTSFIDDFVSEAKEGMKFYVKYRGILLPYTVERITRDQETLIYVRHQDAQPHMQIKHTSLFCDDPEILGWIMRDISSAYK